MNKFNYWLAIHYVDADKRAYTHYSREPGQFYIPWFIGRIIDRPINYLYHSIPWNARFAPHRLLLRIFMCGLIGHDSAFRRYATCATCKTKNKG